MEASWETRQPSRHLCSLSLLSLPIPDLSLSCCVFFPLLSHSRFFSVFCTSSLLLFLAPSLCWCLFFSLGLASSILSSPRRTYLSSFLLSVFVSVCLFLSLALCRSSSLLLSRQRQLHCCFCVSAIVPLWNTPRTSYLQFCWFLVYWFMHGQIFFCLSTVHLSFSLLCFSLLWARAQDCCETLRCLAWAWA